MIVYEWRCIHFRTPACDAFRGHLCRRALCPDVFLAFQSLIQDVVFPLMSYSDDDDQLWNNDPNEYIRIKYGKRKNTCITV